MISCTEFIPAYSELFSFLEDKKGRGEVDNFWAYLFKPDGSGIPLIHFVQREGIRGCYSYWSGTLNEEAADFTLYLNEKAGWFLLDMHNCPSKGRLLKLQDEIGIKPYRHYCLHCDCYRAAIEKVGLGYIYNFSGMDKASCSILIYDPATFKGQIIVDENTEIMDRRASDNEYFHPGFHSSMNRGIQYVGENYGTQWVREYLTRYTKNVYCKTIEDMKVRGLAALEDRIRDTYEKEHATDVLNLINDGSVLKVSVSRCPGVTFLKEIGTPVSAWYRCTTEIVMEVLAEEGGFAFVMDSYDEETGAAAYHFVVK